MSGNLAAAQRDVRTGAQLRRLLPEKAGLEAVGGVGVGAVQSAAGRCRRCDRRCVDCDHCQRTYEVREGGNERPGLVDMSAPG